MKEVGLIMIVAGAGVLVVAFILSTVLRNVGLSKRSWTYATDGQHHAIEARWSKWTGAGQIDVDGRMVTSWGLRIIPTRQNFSVAYKRAFVRWRGVISQNPELYVEEERIASVT